jgi:hypothetical protein
VWLAFSEERGATVSGRYFHHMRSRTAHPAASDATIQNGFLAACEQLTGVRLGSASQELIDSGSKEDDARGHA